jgi:hypothetical protein
MHLKTSESAMDNALPDQAPTAVKAGAVPTDALLVQASVSCAEATSLLEVLRSTLTDAAHNAFAWHGASIQASWSPAAKRLYTYVLLARRSVLAAPQAWQLQELLATACPAAGDLQVSRLERVFDIAGASRGHQPVFHYAVEMDPEAGWSEQLFEWYDTEHMPGLARVDGCVRAQRFLNHDHGPFSLACYDLVMQEALGSPPWLAIRATDWSSRMRPHFTNTIRTMLEVMPGG